MGVITRRENVRFASLIGKFRVQAGPTKGNFGIGGHIITLYALMGSQMAMREIGKRLYTPPIFAGQRHKEFKR